MTAAAPDAARYTSMTSAYGGSPAQATPEAPLTLTKPVRLHRRAQALPLSRELKWPELDGSDPDRPQALLTRDHIGVLVAGFSVANQAGSGAAYYSGERCLRLVPYAE